jgi:hypothetical protein
VGCATARCGARILIGHTEDEYDLGDLEDDVASGDKKKDRIDPAWPQVADGEHPVSELVSDRQGAMSPFGDVSFPLAEVPYTHPVTRINR